MSGSYHYKVGPRALYKNELYLLGRLIGIEACYFQQTFVD